MHRNTLSVLRLGIAQTEHALAERRLAAATATDPEILSRSELGIQKLQDILDIHLRTEAVLVMNQARARSLASGADASRDRVRREAVNDCPPP